MSREHLRHECFVTFWRGGDLASCKAHNLSCVCRKRIRCPVDNRLAASHLDAK